MAGGAIFWRPWLRQAHRQGPDDYALLQAIDDLNSPDSLAVLQSSRAACSLFKSFLTLAAAPGFVLLFFWAFNREALFILGINAGPGSRQAGKQPTANIRAWDGKAPWPHS